MKVLLISIDTLRSDHLGCYGYNCAPNPTSPFIDSMAEKGVVFEKHYATEVPTPPSYTSLFHGVRGIRNGIYTFAQYEREFKCPTPSLARRFYDTGHRTGAISNLAQIYPWLHSGFQDIHKTGNRFQGGRADEVTDEALRWLKEHGAGDFFLFVHYWTPHVPYMRRSREDLRLLFPAEEYRSRAPSLEYIEKSEHLKERYTKVQERNNDSYAPEGNLATYDANIRYADEAIQRVFAGMRKLGMGLDDVLCVLTSDHGEAFGEYGFWDHQSCYRNISQVPLIFFGAGMPQGRVRAYTQHVDVLPTLCDIAGMEAGEGLCGRSMVEVMDGREKTFRDEVVTETAFVAVQRMLVRDEHALVHTFWNANREHLAEFELFDLTSDPDQLNDISPDKPELAASMRIAMQDWVNREAGGAGRDKLAHMGFAHHYRAHTSYSRE